MIIFPYGDVDEDIKSKSLRGALSKYKNEALQDSESKAWSKAVEDKYENN